MGWCFRRPQKQQGGQTLLLLRAGQGLAFLQLLLLLPNVLEFPEKKDAPLWSIVGLPGEGDGDSTEPATQACPLPNTSRQWGQERIGADGEESWRFPLKSSRAFPASSGDFTREAEVWESLGGRTPQGVFRVCLTDGIGIRDTHDSWEPQGRGAWHSPHGNS